MKRLFDIVLAAAGLLFTLPVLVVLVILVWLQDFHSPFYCAPRLARGGGTFTMIKLRSMRMHGHRFGGSSTSATDPRITRVGGILRRYKLDELPQLINVLRGDMSFVGPRPQVVEELRVYTNEERRLLRVRPGITDLASIVFADEGEILAGSADPDLLYQQIIRPWKSRLGIAYVEHHTVATDLRIIMLTVRALLSRAAALESVQHILQQWHADPALCAVAVRRAPLPAAPPPGAAAVVASVGSVVSAQ